MPLRTIPVAAEMLGLVAAAQPEPLMGWDEKDRRRVLAEHREKDDAGDFLWIAYVMLTGTERPEVLQVPANLGYAEYCRRVAAGLAQGCLR